MNPTDLGPDTAAMHRFLTQLDTSSQSSSDGDTPHSLADKVSRRLERADRRVQRAEQLAVSFASEIEGLKLQLEKEELINAEQQFDQQTLEDQRLSIERLKKEKQQLADQLVEHQQRLEMLLEEHKLMQRTRADERENFETEIAKIQSEKESSNELVKKLQSQVDHAEQLLEQEKKTTQSKISLLEEQIRIEKSKHLQVEHSWNGTVGSGRALQEQIRDANQQIDELRRLVRIADNASKEAEDRMTQLKLSHQQVTNDKNNMQSRIVYLQDELRVAKRSLDLAIDQRSSAESKLEHVKSKARQLKKKAYKEIEEREKVERLLSELKEASTSATERATAANTKLVEKDSKMNQYREEIAELKASHRALRTQYETVSKRAIELKARVAEREAHLGQLKEQADRRETKEKLDALNQSLSSITQLLPHEQRGSDAADNVQLASLRAKLETLRQNRDALKDSLRQSTMNVMNYKELYLKEQAKTQRYENKINKMRSELYSLHQMNDDQVARNRLSLQAKEAESEFVWKKLEEALTSST